MMYLCNMIIYTLLNVIFSVNSDFSDTKSLKLMIIIFILSDCSEIDVRPDQINLLLHGFAGRIF